VAGLPVFFRIGQPFEGALLFLVLPDMKEKLQDWGAVPGEIYLEVVEILMALLPKLLVWLCWRSRPEPFRVDFHHQHVFINRSD
jgi:hypothetical protein